MCLGRLKPFLRETIKIYITQAAQYYMKNKTLHIFSHGIRKQKMEAKT
jgi:hypothetical protein